ncbi:MAG: hypothetical protein L3J54_03460 [Draconibacterium sp.]|nr:hypothetical protein [Draconibacterium sp.]
MKKAIIFILLIALPALAIGQNDASVTSLQNDNTIEKTVAKKTTLSSKAKMQFIKLNRKKNNEIISIKAYRKSLQIKVKTIKLC